MSERSRSRRSPAGGSSPSAPGAGASDLRTTRRRFLGGALAVAGVAVAAPARAFAFGDQADDGLDVIFLARSYRPGDVAALNLTTPARGLVAQVFRREPGVVGQTAPVPPAVSKPRSIRWPGGSGTLHIGIGEWESGLYFLSLRDRDGRTNSAPFIVRPSRPGGSRTLVVLPTNTWGAYNLRDGATWYANPDVTMVDLTRPFLSNSPPHFDGYDRGFQRWFDRSGYAADVVADDDLEAFVSGDDLARLYDLIVFPGHEEYVTEQTYNSVERFQQLGGNLLFLSANNFFYKVIKEGDLMYGRWRWRDLGRPEAQLIGAQYLNWYQGVYKNRPLVVADAPAGKWVFAHTGLAPGSQFGIYGIEIDALCLNSPPGVEVLATVPDIFGIGQTAQMTHYRTPWGAEVFDAGVLNFGGTADERIPGQIVSNLWRRLAKRL